ncbi:hypothetical protein TIFTF001_028995 [Ficus carica]|uniref:Uncharacterized protein n=1 Tax=Ficus carica TaxID=3494 RepID=A0AA88J0T5_FICCA|nr:hypothetical protein TIFTF001_028995 [Ficus carica]
MIATRENDENNENRQYSQKQLLSATSQLAAESSGDDNDSESSGDKEVLESSGDDKAFDAKEGVEEAHNIV